MHVSSITLSIESEFKNVVLIGKAINSLCSLADFSAIDTYQMELCVVEAVNNAIEHAYDGQQGHVLEVRFLLYHNKMTIDVCDTGKVMHQQLLLRENALPTFDAQDLHSLPEGGWGLAIMRQVMDEVTYHTCNGKNVLTLTKRFTSDNSATGDHHALPAS